MTFCLVDWFGATMKIKNRISTPCPGAVVLKLKPFWRLRQEDRQPKACLSELKEHLVN